MTRVGDARHVGFVLAEAVDGAGEVGQQPRPVELVMVGREAEIGLLLSAGCETASARVRHCGCRRSLACRKAWMNAS